MIFIKENRLTKTPGYINISNYIVKRPGNVWCISNRFLGRELQIGSKVEWYFSPDHYWGVITPRLEKNGIGVLNLRVIEVVYQKLDREIEQKVLDLYDPDSLSIGEYLNILDI